MNRRRMAELYALTHRGNPGDVEFYVEACRACRSVLELGCGYGRLCVPLLLRTDVELVGVDLDEGMIELCKEAVDALAPPLRARSSLIQADMRQLELDRRFDAVVIPYNTLYCLLDDEAVSSALRTARAHLKPSGELLLDVYAIPEAERGRTLAPQDPEPLLVVHHDDQQIEVWESSAWYGASQRVDASYLHRIERPGRPPERAEYTISQRYLSESQLRSLVEAAGYEEPRIWIGFGEQRVLRACRGSD